MKRNEDPCRDPASEARDDWADALADGIGCRPLAPLRPNPAYIDAPYKAYCCKIDPATGELVSLTTNSEEETRRFFDNLEGPGPTNEKRRALPRAIRIMSIPERFTLVFRDAQPDPEP